MELDSCLFDLSTSLEERAAEDKTNCVSAMSLGGELNSHTDTLAWVEQTRGVWQREGGGGDDSQVHHLPLHHVVALVGEEEGARGWRVHDGGATV